MSDKHSAKRDSVSTAPYGAKDLDALHTETVMVTPQIAGTLRKDCHFERQRPIAANNVARLASEMQRGWFVRGTPIYVCILPDKTMRIVNGNHTLEAIKTSGISVPLTFVYNRVSNIEAAAAIYANMDLQRVRSWGNALQALSGEQATVFQRKALAAIGLILTNFEKTYSPAFSASRMARFQLFEEYKPVIEMLHCALRGGNSRNVLYINRAGVMAVALVTMKAQPSTATEFWSTLVADDGLKNDDPRKALLRYLAEKQQAGSVGRDLMAKASAAAWNAHFENRALSFCKPTSMHAIRIAGTPWHQSTKAPHEELVPKVKRLAFETGVTVTANGTRPIARFVQ